MANVAETDRMSEILSDWRFPQWEHEDDEDQWLLYQGPHHTLVGEVYLRGEGYKWHCKTSDWREMAGTLEEAKAACEASFWKEAWQRLRDAVQGSEGA